MTQLSKDQILIGIQPIKEVLNHCPDKILEIYTVQSKESDLFDLAKRKNIPIKYVKKDVLTKIAETESHQQVLARIKPRQFLSLKQFLLSESERSFLLILDQIFDPQNFGAILRSAECFGATAVLFSKNRGADLTPIAAKASSGASELIDLIRVSNLAHSIDLLKEHEYEILGAQVSPEAKSIYDFHFSKKTALVMGSEGEGIQPLLKKKLDHSIFIPMKGKISSLNVAQAATALLTLWSLNLRPR